MVKDALAFVDVLVSAFGGTEELSSLRPDGRIANTQIRIGTSTIMVSESSARYPPMAAAFYLYVEDADKAMTQAIACGATLEMAVDDMPYGDRQGGVKDAHGNIWCISQRLFHARYSA